MKCPNCNIDLQLCNDRGVMVNVCPTCKGLWFTPAELDEFEDLAIDPEVKTGSLYVVDWPTQLKCPVCSAGLKRFEYRFFGLQIDCCPEHGFWLEAKDDEKILSLMREEATALDRKFTAEQKWTKQLNHMRSGAFFGKLRTLLHR
ncbi:MAG: zf-TFIIB domain-containing protein [Phycisphaerae bacterium]